MNSQSSRRDFLKQTVAGVALGVASASASAAQEPEKSGSGKLSLEKGLVFQMLSREMSVADRMKMARDAGFPVVQVPTTPDPRAAEEIKKAADAAGVRIKATSNPVLWRSPLSSPDSAVAEVGVENVRTSLHNAKLWGAETILVVPALVIPEVGYREAWENSQGRIRTLLPLAEEVKAVIAVENVLNKVLLSPLEMARYIDEFQSPWVKSWFDIGNVMLYGYPQDWIRTLGKRIAKIHLKDFKMSKNCFSWVNLGDGDVMWPEVRQALIDVGYAGPAICEMKGGDEAYLRDVAGRVDRLLIQG
jgi:L-ribulose-5-phosphate 3-epimerase